MVINLSFFFTVDHNTAQSRDQRDKPPSSQGMFGGCNQQNIWKLNLYELGIQLPTKSWLLKIKRKKFVFIEDLSRETICHFYQSQVSLVTRVSSTMHSSLNFGLSMAENRQHLVINSQLQEKRKNKARLQLRTYLILQHTFQLTVEKPKPN